MPGDGTWRGRAICRDVRFESKGGTFVAARCVDGAWLLVGRSGTACRAPTVGKKQRRRKERCRDVRQASTIECDVTLAQAGMPVLLEGNGGYSITTVVWPRAIAVARRPPRSSEGKPNMQWMKRTSWRSTSPPS